MVKLSKRTLREALGLDSDAALARWFGITQAAVCQWSDDADIPEKRAMEVALRRPDLFASTPNPETRAG